MPRRILIALVLLLSIAPAVPQSAFAQTTCGELDSWIWAQTLLEGNQLLSGGLDPDGNGVACDELWPVPGFAPATWTPGIPANAFPVQLVSITDGDTFDILVDGVPDTVRIYRADTPETYGTVQCGGVEAAQMAAWMLQWNDNGATVYIEQDTTKRDPYDRLLGYLWFEVDGQPYMLNEALIRGGWAADVNYGDNLYDQQFQDAAAFAQNWQLGLWQTCPQGPNPPDQAPAQQPEPQPTQATTIEGPSETDGKAPIPGYEGECDASYPGVCVPPTWVYGDLDCKHVPHRRFQVVAPDPHNFDGDHNGVGCESYSTEYVGLPW